MKRLELFRIFNQSNNETICYVEGVAEADMIITGLRTRNSCDSFMYKFEPINIISSYDELTEVRELKEFDAAMRKLTASERKLVAKYIHTRY